MKQKILFLGLVMLLFLGGCAGNPYSKITYYQYANQAVKPTPYRQKGADYDYHIINIRGNYFAYHAYGDDGMELLYRRYVAPNTSISFETGKKSKTRYDWIDPTKDIRVSYVASLGWTHRYILVRTLKNAETYNTINNRQISGQHYIVVDMQTHAMDYFKHRATAEAKYPAVARITLKQGAAYPWFAHFYYGKNQNKHR